MVAGQTPLSAARFVKVRKTALFVQVALALAIAGIGIALHWPFSETKVTQSLEEGFPATVTFQKFHSTFSLIPVVPVHLIGTYKDPQPGLDLPVKSSSHKSPAPRNNDASGTGLPIALPGPSPR
jgi:hypothetical protein